MFTPYRWSIWKEARRKEREEQEDSLKDLIPELNYRGQKRKFTDSNKSSFKRQRVAQIAMEEQTSKPRLSIEEQSTDKVIKKY